MLVNKSSIHTFPYLLNCLSVFVYNFYYFLPGFLRKLFANKPQGLFLAGKLVIRSNRAVYEAG